MYKKMTMIVLVSIFTLGSFMLNIQDVKAQEVTSVSSVEFNEDVNEDETVVTVEGDALNFEVNAAGANEEQEVEVDAEGTVQAVPAIKEMNLNDTISLGGRMWRLLDPNNGFIMALESLGEMDLEGAQFDQDSPNEILDYFDSTFYNQMHQDDKDLLQEKQFGLTYFEDKLYVTAKLDPNAVILDKVSLEETDKTTNDDSEGDTGFSIWKVLLFVFLILILVAVYLFLKKKNDNNGEKNK